VQLPFWHKHLELQPFGTLEGSGSTDVAVLDIITCCM